MYRCSFVSDHSPVCTDCCLLFVLAVSQSAHCQYSCCEGVFTVSSLLAQDQLAQCEMRVKEKTAQLNELILQVHTGGSHVQCLVIVPRLNVIMAVDLSHRQGWYVCSSKDVFSNDLS